MTDDGLRPGVQTFNWADAGFLELPFGLEQALFRLGEEADGDRPVLVVTRFAPGAVLPLHHHPSPFCDAVVEGSMRVGDDVNPRGTIRILAAGAQYGPSVAGPEGCTLLEFYARDSGRPGIFPPEVQTEEFLRERAKYHERVQTAING